MVGGSVQRRDNTQRCRPAAPAECLGNLLDRPVRRSRHVTATLPTNGPFGRTAATGRFGRRYEGMCRVTSRNRLSADATCWSSSCRRGHVRSALRRPTCAPSTGPGPQFRLGGRVAIHPLDPSAAFRTAVAADSTGIEPLRPGWKRPTRRSRRNAVRKSRGITSPREPGAVGSVSFGRFRCRNSPGAPAGSSILVQESPGNVTGLWKPPACIL